MAQVGRSVLVAEPPTMPAIYTSVERAEWRKDQSERLPNQLIGAIAEHVSHRAAEKLNPMFAVSREEKVWL